MNTDIEVLKQDYILKEVVHSLVSAEGIKTRLNERHPEYLDSDIVIRKVPTLSSSWQVWIHERCIDRFGKFIKLANKNTMTCKGCGIHWAKVGEQCPVCYKRN